MPGKQKLPALMIVMSPKFADGGSQSEPDDDDYSKPSSGALPMDSPDRPAGPPKPGDSSFHDQRQLCSNCKWFDADGADGVGACLMKVPEADFTISDPDASWCKFWGPQDDRSAQSAAQTGVPTPSAAPPPTPPAAA
jgi:hypothetical protein